MLLDAFTFPSPAPEPTNVLRIPWMLFAPALCPKKALSKPLEEPEALFAPALTPTNTLRVPLPASMRLPPRLKCARASSTFADPVPLMLNCPDSSALEFWM